MKHELVKTRKLAERIREELAPFCDRIEIAGSIRRRCPLVGDIDIVALPKPGQFLALQARAREATAPIREGDQEIVLRLANGIQLDLWIAQHASADFYDPKPGNFGSLLVCRTGSTSFNMHLVDEAKKKGYRWNPHHGIFDGHGKCLAAAEEADIFRMLDLDFVKPEDRSR